MRRLISAGLVAVLSLAAAGDAQITPEEAQHRLAERQSHTTVVMPSPAEMSSDIKLLRAEIATMQKQLDALKLEIAVLQKAPAPAPIAKVTPTTQPGYDRRGYDAQLENMRRMRSVGAR